MNTPKNIAIIMDGNGRWAQKQNKNRSAGHKEGVKTLKKIVKAAADLKVESLTVYAFSTENWKRPKAEVDFLLTLMRRTMRNEVEELLQNGVKVNFIGRKDELSENLINEIDHIEKHSLKNKKLTLNIAFNYGGRAEIIDSAKKIAEAYKNNEIKLDQLDENNFSNFLYNRQLQDVELLIRTGGDMRLSNFLLWQSAYAELYFTDKFWPDFEAEDLIKAIKEFKQRERRFGGLNGGENDA
ncbi:MAG: undecaprenyl diphosphate synthase [Halanaerobium sp. 4-GBenrich]|jgi:undecaprenyl diphosphate synthase|uniref:Isoprenyl transferase n=1 Tax=Halanaerobium congolense TaxID=54121 RepID=A0A1G6I7M3_9FIRM|nr:isoprenyl transferase [Halanaerobium congolense]KXS50287.1 MAG: undecaprenyl diphosphate synthase [Halanaerobium sp. T82-1]ODS50452.1 MAG: undecaprenyl diphosphate synthase [Halanaerobium sp. 4-GBenrich]OEG62394.1 MAG: di-trans,poly-cis-decaprenylcistransferase [Halanaerobium sp. MDAL1]PUU91075.1 MAG: undecaprenyl diphosphate synthase [Halanaerobium sp.]PTX17100.1 undecaprenyl diphosphate synthase [Halanaerobium congolense]